MEIFDSDQAAKFLKISRISLYRWIKEEELPYIQTTKKGRLLFSWEKIEEWLEKRIVVKPKQ